MRRARTAGPGGQGKGFGLFLLGALALHLSGMMNLQAQPAASAEWVVYEGGAGPGQGRHIVFVSGDEEYRSEEALPMLAQILARHHGFRCTVLFAVHPETGEINPDYNRNIPGLHLLETADLMVLFTRWRELPEDQMRYIDAYTEAGKPVIGLRTATHAFKYPAGSQNPYAHLSSDSKAPEGGYGRQVLGETWRNHHGVHGKESTRGLINGTLAGHPILRGVEDIWGPTDVYGVRDPGNEEVLVYGQTLRGMTPDAPPNYDKSIMPVAWVRTYVGAAGRPARVFMTTMGASVDFENEGLRRLLVNAAYWSVGLEDAIPEKSVVDFVAPYNPTFFGFGEYRKGMRPATFRLDP